MDSIRAVLWRCQGRFTDGHSYSQEDKNDLKGAIIVLPEACSAF